MTDNVDVTIDSVVNQVDSGLNHESNGVNTSPDVSVQSTNTERMIPQSKVNELVKAVFGRGADKGRREMQQPMNVSPQPQVASSNGFSKEQLDAAIQEGLAKKEQEYISAQQNAEWNHVIQSLQGKVAEGAKKYADFDEKVGILNLASDRLKHLLPLWNSLENAEDVLYELGNNPEKLGKLLQYEYSPALLQREAQKISAAIKQNENATKQSSPREPINHLKPSNLGMDNGKPSVRDERMRYRV